MTAAFVFSILFGFSSSFGESLQIKWILPILATLLIGDTVGASVGSCYTAITNFVPESLFIMFLQYIGMSYHDYLSATLLFAMLAFIIGFVNTSIQARKISLVFPAVLFTTIITTPEDQIPDYFVLNLLEVSVWALVIVVLVSITIVPRFACVELHDRLLYSLDCGKAALDLITKAVMASHHAHARIFLSEVRSILTNLEANQAAMAARVPQAAMEPQRLARALYRGSRNGSCFQKLTAVELLNLSDALLWHFSSMAKAAGNMNYNEYHGVAADKSRVAFIAVADKFCAVIDLLSNSHKEFDAALDRTIESLIHALDHAYSVLSDSLKYADANVRLDKLVSGRRGPGSLWVAGKGWTLPVSVNTDAENSNFDADASPMSNRMAISFYLFHLSEMVDIIAAAFHRSKSSAQASDSVRTTAVDNNNASQANSSATDAPAPAPTSTSKTLMTVFIDTIKGFVPSDWWGRTMTGLRTVLIIGVALIFVEEPTLSNKFENGTWIMYAMIMSQADNLGATFAQMRLRLFGTFLGALYSYFVYIAVGMEIDYQILMFVPFILMCGIVKQNKSWAYFGSISSTTAQIVTFGRVAFVDPVVGDYVLLRIQENAMGIVLILLISLMALPKLARDLLNLNHLQFLYKVEAATLKVWELYKSKVPDIGISTESVNEEKEGNALETSEMVQYKLSRVTGNQEEREMQVLHLVQESVEHPVGLIVSECAAISAILNEQPLLMEQCSIELLFLSKPFSRDSYESLYYKEREILDLLRCLDRTAMKISAMANMQLAEASVSFASKVKQGFMDLVVQILLSMRLSVEVLENSLATYKTIRSVPSVPAPEILVVSDLEEERNSVLTTEYSAAAPRDMRAEHSQRMEQLHLALVRLSVTNARLIDWMHEDITAGTLNPPSNPYEQKRGSEDTSRCMGTMANLSSAVSDGGEKRDAVTILYEKDGDEKDGNDEENPRDINAFAHSEYLQDVNTMLVNSRFYSRGPAAAEVEANMNNGIGDSGALDEGDEEEEKKTEIMEAAVHRLFNIQISFNSFFYSCHHLAFAVMDMSDHIFTLTELSQDENRQPF
eukprot:gene24891-33383_t